MSAWTYRSSNGNADPKIVPPRPRIPSWKGLGADSEEKHEPVSDIDTVAVDSLKALDPQWPIREEKRTCVIPPPYARSVPTAGVQFHDRLYCGWVGGLKSRGGGRSGWGMSILTLDGSIRALRS